MIYECPNCQTPQEAGQTVCPHCHAEFDGPVPDDAIVPPVDAVAASTVSDEVAATSIQTASGDAELSDAASETVLPLAGEAFAPSADEAVLPPSEAAVASPLVEVTPAASTPAFPPAQAYAPPADFSQPPEPPFGRLSRVLLIAFPVVLVLVLGGVFYTNSLNSDANTAPVPLPAVHSSAPPAPLPAAPATSPTYLQGGGNTNNAADDPRAKLLAGRWESKSGDYYVFNSDGTGSRGSLVKQPEQAFLWGLVQNRVMLYMDKNEMLRFNAGPDDDTIFLAGQTGSYIQYSRSKTT